MRPGRVVDVAIVGAGPCGLATAIAATRAGMTPLMFDRGPIVAGLASYPAYMSFFSTAERLSIGDIPFVVPTDKPTRREALAYYRAVASHYDVEVRQYETVLAVERLGHDDMRFVHDLCTRRCRCHRLFRAAESSWRRAGRNVAPRFLSLYGRSWGVA
jgi:cation diffusion facilitator CzcD-associated flavoprotein CzcO